jgi:AcrR family transcriptional regulator
MQAVIEESGLSAGCIYGHFQSKEDLIEAISMRRHRRDAELLACAPDASDPLTSLRAIAHAFLTDVQTPGGLRTRRVGVQLWAESLHNDAIRKQVTDGLVAPLDQIERHLKRAKRLSLIQGKVDTRMLARMFVALFQGLALQRAWGEPLAVDALVKTFDALLLGGWTGHWNGGRIGR